MFLIFLLRCRPSIAANLPNDVTIVIDNDGSFTVTPGNSYEGGTEITIPYLVTDSNGLTSESTIVVQIPEVAQVALVKSAQVIGDQIIYTFTVTNTGNITLNNLEINDTMLSATAIAVVPSTLAPGASATVTVTYDIVLADLNAGSVTNTATASGVSTIGTPVSDISGSTITNDDPTRTQLVQNPAITLIKTSIFNDENANGYAEVGETITYTFVATNTGNVTLSNVALSDALLNVTDLAFAPNTLDPGQNTTLQLVYILTQNDVNLGLVVNSAEVQSTAPNGDLVFDISGTTNENDEPTSTELIQDPQISIIKTAVFNDENGDGVAQVGETISYQFSIKNTGTVSLYNVIVEDTLPGLILTGNPIAVLNPDETNNTAYSAVYALTLQDLINGSVTNQATALGTTLNDDLVTDDSDFSEYSDNNLTIVVVEGCKINIFNAISPDDGMNDFFYIQGVECYSDNKLEIYNRWGVLVYEQSGYNNADKVFKGYSEGRVTVSSGEPLPVGTYFYIFRYVDLSGKTHKIQSYLYLNR